jgi:hypothetical protein
VAPVTNSRNKQPAGSLGARDRFDLERRRERAVIRFGGIFLNEAFRCLAE